MAPLAPGVRCRVGVRRLPQPPDIATLAAHLCNYQGASTGLLAMALPGWLFGDWRVAGVPLSSSALYMAAHQPGFCTPPTKTIHDEGPVHEGPITFQVTAVLLGQVAAEFPYQVVLSFSMAGGSGERRRQLVLASLFVTMHFLHTFSIFC